MFWFLAIILGGFLLALVLVETETRTLISLLAKIGIIVVTVRYSLLTKLGFWAYTLGFLTLLPFGVWIVFFYLLFRLNKMANIANYHDYDSVVSTVNWFFQYDPLVSKYKSVVISAQVAEVIYENLNKVKTKDEFLNYFLNHIALHDIIVASLANLYQKYGNELDNEDVDSIPEPDLDEWYRLVSAGAFLTIELRVLGWLFNKTYGEEFDPAHYDDEINKYKEDILGKERRASEFDIMRESGVAIPNYYQILGVDPKATAEQITAAYKELAKKVHPDVQPESEKPKSDSLMTQINVAYSILKNPAKRAEYDAYLRSCQNENGARDVGVKVETSAPHEEKVDKGIRVSSSFSPLLAGVVVVLTFIIIMATLSSFVPENAALDTQSSTPTEPSLMMPKTNDPVAEGYHDFSSSLSADEVLVGFISASSLNLRSGPGIKHDVIQALRPEVNMVIVHGKQGDWYLVDWFDAESESPEPKGHGWVNGKYIDLFKFNGTSQTFSPIKEQELSSK